jgi:hypothetical protein
VLHFLFSLLKIMGLYMFRALLAHPQEVMNKGQLVYCVRFMCVGCTSMGEEHSNAGAASDEQVMPETCRGP